ncbi:hypothetical protein C8R44DRAFT_802810 [Mycena epipterygia]|nr:hypothetical protein C8R44DRAFT_802810 [Mycena epipterygia]
MSYDRYRDYRGERKFEECMRPHILQFACETVAEEMETRRKNLVLQGIEVVTPEFIDAWNLDEEVDMIPFLTQILETAAQTDHAKLHNKKKKPENMCQVMTRQLLYQSSNRCLAFQAEFGLFLWSTGCSRATIDALFRCGLSVCYDSVLNLIESLADHCMLECIKIILHPHSFNSDNLNRSCRGHFLKSLDYICISTQAQLVAQKP